MRERKRKNTKKKKRFSLFCKQKVINLTCPMFHSHEIRKKAVRIIGNIFLVILMLFKYRFI